RHGYRHTFPTRRSSDLKWERCPAPGTSVARGRSMLVLGGAPLSDHGRFRESRAAILVLDARSARRAPTARRTSHPLSSGLGGKKDRKSTRLNSSHVKIS